MITADVVFTLVFGAVVMLERYFIVRLHDLLHDPDKSWLQRLPGYRLLDRHHYLHHIDMRANTHFLLPLGDWRYGTLRVPLTARERDMFPDFETARTTLHDPTGCAPEGMHEGGSSLLKA